jgi:hypothetical protein
MYNTLVKVTRVNAEGNDLYEKYPWFHKRFPDPNNIQGRIYAHGFEDGLAVVQFLGTGQATRFRYDQIMEVEGD